MPAFFCNMIHFHLHHTRFSFFCFLYLSYDFYSSHIVQTVTGFSHDALCDFQSYNNACKTRYTKTSLNHMHKAGSGTRIYATNQLPCTHTRTGEVADDRGNELRRVCGYISGKITRSLQKLPEQIRRLGSSQRNRRTGRLQADRPPGGFHEETGVAASIIKYIGKSQYTFNTPQDTIERPCTGI